MNLTMSANMTEAEGTENETSLLLLKFLVLMPNADSPTVTVSLFWVILQNFLAISVDRILSALKITQLFETEIVWKYVLNNFLTQK